MKHAQASHSHNCFRQFLRNVPVYIIIEYRRVDANAGASAGASASASASASAVPWVQLKTSQLVALA